MSESNGSLGPDPTPAGTRPIDVVIQEKQRALAAGAYLSEICEEPRSTEQNVSPSVEPEISRISSKHDDSGLASATHLPQLNRKESSIQHTRQEREDEATAAFIEQQLPSTSSQHHNMIEVDNVDEQPIHNNYATAGNQAANAVLPPSTKKYTLVLDLDETLIHSHVQYKKRLETRAE